MKKLLILAFSMMLSTLLIFSCEKDEIITEDLSFMKAIDADDTQLNHQNDVSALQNNCTTIQSGELVDSEGQTIMPGFHNNYNYQAHMFRGEVIPGFHLMMKWNDTWLSNKDCDGDGMLDRPVDEDGNQHYAGTDAWVTNHWTRTYYDADGNLCEYDAFLKIIAVPEDAYIEDGFYYNGEGELIGEFILPEFAVVQYIVNDPCHGIEGLQFMSPDHGGLGNF
jgi:hypothetical protein